jgi:hypothetical protein
VAASIDRRARRRTDEPCEAWWIQSNDVFVDIRVTLPGHDDNGLPYSSTRAFAGVFEIADGHSCWHVELDSGDAAPRTIGPRPRSVHTAATILVLIEDAPDGSGRSGCSRRRATTSRVVHHATSCGSHRRCRVSSVVATFGDVRAAGVARRPFDHNGVTMCWADADGSRSTRASWCRYAGLTAARRLTQAGTTLPVLEAPRPHR